MMNRSRMIGVCIPLGKAVVIEAERMDGTGTGEGCGRR